FTGRISASPTIAAAFFSVMIPTPGSYIFVGRGFVEPRKSVSRPRLHRCSTGRYSAAAAPLLPPGDRRLDALLADDTTELAHQRVGAGDRVAVHGDLLQHRPAHQVDALVQDMFAGGEEVDRHGRDARGQVVHLAFELVGRHRLEDQADALGGLAINEV